MIKHYIIGLMVALLPTFAVAQVVNKVASSSNFKTTTTSDGITITASPIVQKNNVKSDAATHILRIAPIEGCRMMVITNGNDYSTQIWEDVFEDTVPEGVYSVHIEGYADGYSRLLSYKNIEVYEDVVFTPSLFEANHAIINKVVDENGTHFNDLNVLDCNRILAFKWANVYESVWDIPIQLDTEYSDTIPHVRFNEINDQSTLGLYSVIVTDDQKVYVFDHHTVSNISEDIINENNPSDFINHKEYFHCNGEEEHFFNMSYRYDEPSGWIISSPLRTLEYDMSLPITVFADAKIESETQECRFSILPEIYESIPEEWSWPEYFGRITTGSMWVGTDGKFRREPFDMFHWDINAFYFESAPNYFPNTPALCKNNPNDTLYFGFRTPLTYFQSHGLYDLGGVYDAGVITFVADGGCQKPCDENSTVTVKFDGEVVYDFDALYFNNMPMGTRPNEIDIEVENNRVVVNGVEKKNKTLIHNNLTTDDAYAPTMTILKVMQDGSEVIEVTDLNAGRIEFAAGDFYPTFDTIKIHYNAAPRIIVEYKTESSEYQTLEYSEDASLFHANYGNYYIIDMSQISNMVNNQWVSLKFVVTDEAGNSQTQELHNLFYVGQMTSVNDFSSNAINHSVNPNPFSNTLNITTEPVNGTATFNVFNSVGQLVYTTTMSCNETTEFQWKAEGMATGMYMYQIATENGIIQGRAIRK